MGNKLPKDLNELPKNVSLLILVFQGDVIFCKDNISQKIQLIRHCKVDFELLFYRKFFFIG